MSGFFDSFIESIQSLPCNIQRNFNLITELERKAYELSKAADQLSEEYLKNVKNMSPEEKVERYQKIMALYEKGLNYTHEKMQLSQQTYNMVDRQIIQIDEEIKKVEHKKPSDDSGTASTQKQGKRGRKKEEVEVDSELQSIKSDLALNMEIDPNEPLYCLCQQVSFGEMVGCDEKDCPNEWFHFPCVGLTSKPKGKWFCPDCTQKKKNRQ